MNHIFLYCKLTVLKEVLCWGMPDRFDNLGTGSIICVSAGR